MKSKRARRQAALRGWETRRSNERAAIARKGWETRRRDLRRVELAERRAKAERLARIAELRAKAAKKPATKVSKISIRYRDSKGHIITKSKASKLKKVRSEMVEGNKVLGRSVDGFVVDMKKLARLAMPKVKVKPQRILSKPMEEDFDFDSDESDEETEDEWDSMAADFPEIDAGLDDLDSLIDDEDEWYEHQ